MIKNLIIAIYGVFLLTSTAWGADKISSISKESGKEVYKFTLGENNDDVVIGDDKSANLKAQIKFTKWNKEESLTIKSDISGTPETVDGKLKVAGKDRQFYFDRNSDDILKFGVVFEKKPSSNVIEYQLEGWENFHFFYQRPLEHTNSDGSMWEIDARGRHLTCPANVGGSYAIYHRTKRNHIEGQTNYETGKFGHYYRPRFIDADGNFVWADLNISNGWVTITIPQDFLDKAKYPVRANDDFGYSTVGSKEVTNADGTYPEISFATSTPASNGTLTSISLYSKANSVVMTLYPGIYSDSSTYPATRLASSNSSGTALSGSYGWVSMSLSYGSITSGAQYWIGAATFSSADQYSYKYDDCAAQEDHYPQSPQSDWPTPWPSPDYNDPIRRSVYATYTASGGATRRIMLIE